MKEDFNHNMDLPDDLHRPFHNMKKDEVMEYLKVKSSGLTSLEVEQRRQKYGMNVLRESKKETILEIFLNQFKDLLIIILIIAAIISGYIGYVQKEGFTDAILIGTILIVNAIMGVYQEWRADKAIEALKKMVAHNSRTIRDGEEVTVRSEELVPGDIIVIEQGDRIPADSRLIEANNLRTEEAQLTGESTEVSKSSFSIVPSNSQIGDHINSIFMGTHVTFGKGKAVVTRTGMDTEMGKIADSVQEISKEPTPTQIKLEEFGKNLSIIIIGLMVIMVLYGVLFLHYQFTDILIIAVSLSVAAIPEGLAIVITLALALGVQKMAKQQAIVKKLPAVESLGSVTTICTDKTGTLTLNEMAVQKIVLFGNQENTILSPDKFAETIKTGNVSYKLLSSAILCNNARISGDDIFGDPTELALLRVADSINFARQDYDNQFQRLDEIPFDSERKQMTVVVESFISKERVAFTKGAPEIIMKGAKYIDFGNGPETLTEEIKIKIQKTIDGLAEHALRVLGFGYYELKSSSYNVYEFENNIVFCGLMGMIDPPKPGVKEAVEICKKAGIRVVMVTGDHKKTAIAIGKQIGIAKEENEVIDGITLDSISDADLENHIKSISVFARITPQHKLRIVKALKSKGEIVAMTGDGVNDAPALKGADVGIAMGNGTDVTKETAEMVLEDDNFTTIVHAVSAGRGIYDNMTKFIRYMLASNAAEIVVIFLGIVLGLEPPLIAVQILWVNLVTDGVPALALGVDPTEQNIMLRPPRDPQESLLSRERINHIFLFGMWISIVTLGSYILFYTTNIFGTKNDLNKARTIAFTILSLSQFAHALNVRESTASILNKNFFKNKVLLITVIVSIILQVMVVQGDMFLSFFAGHPISFINPLFSTTELSAFEWVWVGGFSASLVFYAETLKFIKRNTRFTSIC